jgi:hypothetical protein
MTESPVIWSNNLIVFDRSIGVTQNVILSHARIALQALISRIDHLHELVATTPRWTNMHPHPEIPSTLTDIASQQGIASTILFDDVRRAKENERDYKVRQNRISYVKSHCACFPTAGLSNRKIRNSLTHIDEYLISAMKKPNTGWFVDCAIIRRDEFIPPNGLQIGFCRTYISSEDVILHLGNEIVVSTLRQEAQNVLTAIWGEPAHEPPQLPGETLQAPQF